MTYNFSSNNIAKDFLTSGYIHLRKCFSEKFCNEWTLEILPRIEKGENSKNESSFITRLKATKAVLLEQCSPLLFKVVNEIVGGKSRIVPPILYNSFVLNMMSQNDWTPPSKNWIGWHIDGYSFRHFLDSPDLALTLLIYFSDVNAKGGGTFISIDSIPRIAKLLRDTPEGILPWEFPYKSIINDSNNYQELVGQTGDVFILHPFMLHTSSQNCSTNMRILSNPFVELKKPLEFNCLKKCSLLEFSILQSLNISSLNFKIQGSREKVLPRW